MWKNYFKIALRNLWKQKAFSLINILGLALGMACCFLFIQYVWHETSYDSFHPTKDRLYRLNYRINLSNEMNMARTPPAVAPAIDNYFPEVEATARLYPRDVSVKIADEDKQLEVANVFFADSTATDIFQFEFLHGNPNTALDNPFSVVLTDNMAIKLYGKTDVVGRQLQLASEDNFQITGVVKDWKDRAHLEFNMLVPFQNMVDMEPPHARERMQLVLENNWIATHSYTYVLLNENQSVEKVNDKFDAFLAENGDERFKEKQKFWLFPVKDIHLYSAQDGENVPSTNLNLLTLFIGIGLITLVIACINFINLTTAGSLNRSREVGIRKVLGAKKGSLIGQFLGESMILSFIAFVISLFLANLGMPFINSITDLDLVFAPWENFPLFITFIGVFALAGILAGSYPAFFVSKFDPVIALKGSSAKLKKAGGVSIRKVLITLQFLVAIVFISTAGVIYLQLDFFRSQPLGFDQELTLMVPLDSDNNINAVFRPGDAQLRQRMNTLDEELLTHPNIKAVTQCSQQPGMGAIGRNVWTEKVPREDNFFGRVLSVDYDYPETIGLEVIAGREFDASFGTDHLSSFVINESAVSSLLWESPEEAIGQKLTVEGKEGTVVGVVKDYHYASLYSEIDALILEVRPGAFSYFGVRLENGNIPETLSFIEDKWQQFFPEKAFEYEFLDQSLANIYRAEERMSNMISAFALIAILISCFGLFGLAALVTQHRFKEIAIRKILGANLNQILNILAIDFLKLIGIAMILAIPLTWYFGNQWMEDFANKIDFPWWITFATGMGVIFIAFVTISAQTIKAALANPVESLRHE